MRHCQFRTSSKLIRSHLKFETNLLLCDKLYKKEKKKMISILSEKICDSYFGKNDAVLLPTRFHCACALITHDRSPPQGSADVLLKL